MFSAMFLVACTCTTCAAYAASKTVGYPPTDPGVLAALLVAGYALASRLLKKEGVKEGAEEVVADAAARVAQTSTIPSNLRAYFMIAVKDAARDYLRARGRRRRREVVSSQVHGGRPVEGVSREDDPS